MSKQSGYIYEVLEGSHKGEYAISIHKEQDASFERLKKVFVHFYAETLCTQPVKDQSGKKVVGLIGTEKLRFIGFSD
jgi:hypothetical protein